MNLNIKYEDFTVYSTQGGNYLKEMCSYPERKAVILDSIRGLLEDIGFFNTTCQLLDLNMSAYYDFKKHDFICCTEGEEPPSWNQAEAKFDRIIYLIQNLSVELFSNQVKLQDKQIVACYLTGKFIGNVKFNSLSESIKAATLERLSWGESLIDKLVRDIEEDSFDPSHENMIISSTEKIKTIELDVDHYIVPDQDVVSISEPFASIKVQQLKEVMKSGTNKPILGGFLKFISAIKTFFIQLGNWILKIWIQLFPKANH